MKRGSSLLAIILTPEMPRALSRGRRVLMQPGKMVVRAGLLLLGIPPIQSQSLGCAAWRSSLGRILVLKPKGVPDRRSLLQRRELQIVLRHVQAR